ncbi:MAG: TIGR02301 family protein [Maricaulaceae bacterium]|nr:TIGR02301 family protein [Maricaulaceae bacterium]
MTAMRLLAALVLIFAAPAALAQDAKPGEAAGWDDPERAVPYLAYTLGELHYLAFACEGSQAQRWRGRMAELLDLEAPEAGYRRERLVQAFNDGFHMQQRFPRRCGAESEAETYALARRGQELSEAMRARYSD